MSKKPSGTFADLYDAEKSIHATRSGRPRRKTPRKQVTLYLTQEQEEALADLQYTWRKRFKVDRSDLAGLAIEVLAQLLTEHNGLSDFKNFESLKVQIHQMIPKEGSTTKG